jgi:DNA topoisomerase-2
MFDDGQKVEPEYYAPVLPMILVNGAEGIGTGFSCYVPPFDPSVIKHNILCALRQVDMVPMVPYFRGFKGTVTRAKEHAWVLEGTYEREGSQIRITELPPGKWIQDFKEHLDDLIEKGVIQKFENHSTETSPDFRVWADLENPSRSLGLTKTIHTSNMYLISPNGSVKKYASPEEILIDYIEVRLQMYRHRKSAQLKEMDAEIQWLSEKARFIRDVAISKRIQVFNRPIEDIYNQLREEVYAEAMWPRLLDIKTYQYTLEEVEKLQKLCEARKAERDTLKATTVVQMWEKNLAEL